MGLQTDFMIAVQQIAAERGIDMDEVMLAIKEAIKTIFKKDESVEEEGQNLEVEIDQVSGEVTVYADKKVVDEATDPLTQISIKEAKKLESKLRVGDHIEVDITPQGDFGRVAAQAAKQVILQKLRESEKESQIKKFVDRVGEIETGVVQRVEGDTIYWELGKAVANMPATERIQNEFYKSGTRHKLLLKEIRQTPHGRNIIVSRSDPAFLSCLFELEVPELISGAVEIKAIAREAGERSKVAVTSTSDGIDPIGACVGQRGSRIIAIMNELKIGNTEEKIDIILWDPDESRFVVNALSPAQVIRTEVTDPANRTIRVTVPDDQLSLAIGREGQNVRLAAKLTGWNIDIQGETVKVENPHATGVVSDSAIGNEFPDNLSGRTQKALEKAGLLDKEKLMEVMNSGEKIVGIGKKGMEEIKVALKL